MEDKESEIESAIEQTREAEEAIKEIEDILKYRLNRDSKDIWKVIGTIYDARRTSTINKERRPQCLLNSINL